MKGNCGFVIFVGKINSTLSHIVMFWALLKGLTKNVKANGMLIKAVRLTTLWCILFLRLDCLRMGFIHHSWSSPLTMDHNTY